MRKALMFVLAGALCVVVVAAGATVQAAEFGTAAEAKAMLEKAVAAIKKDKTGSLTKFSKGEGGFKDRDLYPFCGGADGNFTAHPTLAGKSLKGLKDKAGKALGEEIYKVVQVVGFPKARGRPPHAGAHAAASTFPSGFPRPAKAPSLPPVVHPRARISHPPAPTA
ncbi:MAG: cache domain-containing protein [candidate division NC10 bacterium]|nr:cache domain-containing protein [candidate division NC10 bacterium]